MRNERLYGKRLITAYIFLWYRLGNTTGTQSMKAKRAAIYLRVSTDGQTTENQRLALAAVAARKGWDIVQEYADSGISGAKGRHERPGSILS